MRALLEVLLQALSVYSFIIILSAIISWLLAFNVINYRNEFVRAVWNGLNAITEPALRPIRRFLPNLGGVDISPIILLLIIMLIQKIIEYNFLPLVSGASSTGFGG